MTFWNGFGQMEAISRQSVLLPPGGFATPSTLSEAVGNVFARLGKPGGVVRDAGGAKTYSYTPFHQFDFSLPAAADQIPSR